MAGLGSRVVAGPHPPAMNAILAIACSRAFVAYTLAHLDTSPTAYAVARNALTGLLLAQLRRTSCRLACLAPPHGTIDDPDGSRVEV